MKIIIVILLSYLSERNKTVHAKLKETIKHKRDGKDPQNKPTLEPQP